LHKEFEIAFAVKVYGPNDTVMPANFFVVVAHAFGVDHLNFFA